MEMEGGILLDVVGRDGSSILELLASADKYLLISWQTQFKSYLFLDFDDRVRRLDFEDLGL